MARDEGLEELLRETLDEMAGERPGLAETRMFGGFAWLLDGHLLCGASDRGLLVRLGKGQDGWALAIPDIEPLRGRFMPGWVRAGPEAYGDDALRERLIAAALAFVEGLPPKL